VLPDGETVRSVYLDKETGCLAGIKGAVKSGHTVQKILVECGTIECAAIEEVGKKVRTFESSMPKGCALNFVDAPVSGGPMAAETGTLAFMGASLDLHTSPPPQHPPQLTSPQSASTDRRTSSARSSVSFATWAKKTASSCAAK
jgi:hypothetical protein